MSVRAVFTTEARELVQARRHHVLLYQRASAKCTTVGPTGRGQCALQARADVLLGGQPGLPGTLLVRLAIARAVELASIGILNGFEI